MAGDPRNHSAQMQVEQIDALRKESGLTIENEWDSFDLTSETGKFLALRSAALKRQILLRL